MNICLWTLTQLWDNACKDAAPNSTFQQRDGEGNTEVKGKAEVAGEKGQNHQWDISCPIIIIHTSVFFFFHFFSFWCNYQSSIKLCIYINVYVNLSHTHTYTHARAHTHTIKNNNKKYYSYTCNLSHKLSHLIRPGQWGEGVGGRVLYTGSFKFFFRWKYKIRI